jgi:hypothetical protein
MPRESGASEARVDGETISLDRGGVYPLSRAMTAEVDYEFNRSISAMAAAGARTLPS